MKNIPNQKVRTLCIFRYMIQKFRLFFMTQVGPMPYELHLNIIWIKVSLRGCTFLYKKNQIKETLFELILLRLN